MELCKKKPTSPVAIVGGGIAGLTAAEYLHRRNVPFVLFEANSEIAGLCRSFKDEDGFSYDFGAHFVTNRLAAAVGVSDQCRTVRSYGETVELQGRAYSYPFGLAIQPRMAMSAAIARAGTLLGKGSLPGNAGEWFRQQYGEALANQVALPLIEAWSGVCPEELATSVGDSLPDSVLKTLYLKVASKVLRRAVACGYSQEAPESPNVWHVYPENGVATICEKLAEDIQDRVHLNTPVEKIVVEGDRAVGVQAGGEFHPASAVISTAPVFVLPKLVSGTSALDELAEFRYRPMTFVNLRLKGRGLLPNVVVWYPEEKYPFFRLTEAPLSMPWLAPEGKTIVTADIGCQTGDDIWKMDEEQLAELCLASMESLIPDIRERFLGCNVLRTPIAYPVFLNKYENVRRRLMDGLPVENLLSVGRNGEFSHMFMEDVYWRTRKRIDALIKNLAANSTDRESSGGVVSDNRNKVGNRSGVGVEAPVSPL